MGDDDKQRSNNVFHYEGGVPIFNARLDEVERKQADAEAREKTYRDQQLSINKWMMRFTGMLVVLATLTGVINGVYTAITKISADAARSAAETAQKTLGELKKGGSDTHELAVQAKTQADEAQQAIVEARRNRLQAEKSLNATIAQFRQDQRAWVGIDNMAGKPVKGQVFKVVLTVKNTGKTPATNVRIWNHSQILAEIPDINNGCRSAFTLNPAGPRSVMNPGEFFLAAAQPFTDPLPTELKDMLGSWTFYVYGCATYDDVYREHHWFTFCSRWDEHSQGFIPCDKFNNTGEGFLPPA